MKFTPLLSFLPSVIALCKTPPLSLSPSLWTSLNTTLSGALLSPTPPALPCHTSPSSLQCASIQSAWYTEPFHVQSPISPFWPNWSNDSCLPFPDTPCVTTGFPSYVVNASSASHISAALQFAKTHNLRVVIKNSGHDYVGRSSGGQSLGIWVHYMRGIEEHPNGVELAGKCGRVEGHLVTVGAGMAMEEVYRETAKMGRTVVGGNGRSVKLGGYITGGGHSILAGEWGMAGDRAVEMEVVMADGTGGGGTFGVMTKVTIQTVPSPQVITLNFQFATAASNPGAFDAIAWFVSQFPALADQGVTGYPIIFNRVGNVSDAGRSQVSGVIGKLITLHTNNTNDIMKTMGPLFDHIHATWPGFEFFTEVKYYPNFGKWYDENFDPSPVGFGSVMSSRLLDRQALEGNVTALRVALERFSAGGQATVYIVSGRGVHQAKPSGGSTAVNPAWRRTYVHATATVNFAALNATAKDEAIAKTHLYAEGLKELAPNTGAYVNEASKYEENWQQTFWGSNYAKLLELKRKVDPDDVFWCQPCVGSERWKEVDANALSKMHPVTPSTFRLHTTSLLLSLGTFTWGYNIGILASILSNNHFQSAVGPLTTRQFFLFAALLTATYYIGTFFSYLLLAHPLADRLGRRNASLVGMAILCLGQTLQASADGCGID
ncbi:hypothetical protein OQA88_7506 [Cercophora sp. LCS_1]